MATANCPPDTSSVHGCEWLLRRNRSQKQSFRIDRARSSGRASQRRANSRGNLRLGIGGDQKVITNELKQRHGNEIILRDDSNLNRLSRGGEFVDVFAAPKHQNVDSTIASTTKATVGNEVLGEYSSAIAEQFQTSVFDKLELSPGICVERLISKLINDAVDVETDVDAVDVETDVDADDVCSVDEIDGLCDGNDEAVAIPSSVEERLVFEFGEAKLDLSWCPLDVCEQDVELRFETESEEEFAEMIDCIETHVCFEKVCPIFDDEIVEDFQWFEEEIEVRVDEVATKVDEARIREEDALRLRAIVMEHIQIETAEDLAASALKQEEAVARRKAEEEKTSRQRMREKKVEELTSERAAKKDVLMETTQETLVCARMSTEKIGDTDVTKEICDARRCVLEKKGDVLDEKACAREFQESMDVEAEAQLMKPTKEDAFIARDSAKTKGGSTAKRLLDDKARARTALAARRAQKVAERKATEGIEMTTAAEDAARLAKEAAERMAAEDEAASAFSHRMVEKMVTKKIKTRKSAERVQSATQEIQTKVSEEEAIARVKDVPDETGAGLCMDGLDQLRPDEPRVCESCEEAGISSAENVASERMKSQSTTSLQGDRSARSRRRIIGRVVRDVAPVHNDVHVQSGSSVRKSGTAHTAAKKKGSCLRPVEVFSMDMDAEPSSCEVRESSLVRGYDALDVQFFSIQDNDDDSCSQRAAPGRVHPDNTGPSMVSETKIISRRGSLRSLCSTNIDGKFDLSFGSRLAPIPNAQQPLSTPARERVLSVSRSKQTLCASPSRSASACRGMLKSNSASSRMTTLACSKEIAMVKSLYSSKQAPFRKLSFPETMKRTVEMARTASLQSY